MNTGNWPTVDTLLGSSGLYTKGSLFTTTTTYEFQLTIENDCNQTFKSRTHRSILLELEDEHRLQWNEYVEWSIGVEEYILERNVDKNGWREIDRTTLTDYV